MRAVGFESPCDRKELHIVAVGVVFRHLRMVARDDMAFVVCRDEMLAIAPECKSLPDGLGVIPECLSSLFDVGEPTTVRARGKGRVGSSCDSGGRKRVEDSVRTAEQPTSVWRKKDRGAGETPERTERCAALGSVLLLLRTLLWTLSVEVLCNVPAPRRRGTMTSSVNSVTV